MTEHKIGEVFLDAENFNPPKKVKCVKGKSGTDDCEHCCYNSCDCKLVRCLGEENEDGLYRYFIETKEPLTTKKP